MSKVISITDEIDWYLMKKACKDEEGNMEETYSQVIKRLLNIK